MPWCYEIRDSDNRVLQLHSGFRSEREARKAGRRTKRMIDCFCFPNLETLTVVTKKLPGAHRRRLPEPNFKYAWQVCVFDAFMEPNPVEVPLMINIAERAISSRLLDPSPGELEERIALKEALLALRRLLHQFVHDEQQLAEKKKSA